MYRRKYNNGKICCYDWGVGYFFPLIRYTYMDLIDLLESMLSEEPHVVEPK